MRKSLLLIFLIVASTYVTQAQQQVQGTADSRADEKPEALLSGQNDSLRIHRTVLATSIFRGQVKLPPASVLALYKNDPGLDRQYRTGRIFQTAGPLLSLAGVALGYISIKGKPASEVVVYRNDYFTVNYTERSRPLLFAGLGFFTGGIGLVELSNELITRSVRQYNARFRKSATPNVSFRLGITPSAGVGLYARF